MVAPTKEARSMTDEGDFLKLNNIDYVQIWVGNAKQAMYLLVEGIRFQAGGVFRFRDRKPSFRIVRTGIGKDSPGCLSSLSSQR